ncbi:hypothetical protein Tco_0916813 [Tanacetum coccineum]
MHNDIMVAGSKERPPMLASGSCAQWKSQFMIYVDTKPNRELLKQTIYEVTEKETYANAKPENKKLIDAKAEAVHMILNGIENDIYFTVDACPHTKEMWIAIERVQQGESINIQDVKTKLFWKLVNVRVSTYTLQNGQDYENSQGTK